MTVPALQLSGIRKRFGQLAALDGANLIVRKGTVHALLGENGAGKTTLMRIAFGLAVPDEGTITVDGVPDRVVVVFDGRVREVARDPDAVSRAMLGAA